MCLARRAGRAGAERCKLPLGEGQVVGVEVGYGGDVERWEQLWGGGAEQWERLRDGGAEVKAEVALMHALLLGQCGH